MPSFSSMDDYLCAVLRKTVASQCQVVGWQHISGVALDVLCDIMRHHILSLSRRTAAYSQQAGRFLANLDDATLALADLNMCPRQLERYLSIVEAPSFVGELPPPLPLKRESRLNFLRPGSQEIVTRPIHIYEYLPPMLLDEPGTTADVSADGDGLTPLDSSDTTVISPTKSQVNSFTAPANLCSPSGKRPTPDGSSSVETATRRARSALVAVSGDDAGARPVRELSSLMMTTSGFISPAVQGKMPDGKIPDDFDDHRDGHGKLKTRKQRVDTYRRMSERENERKIREKELWSNDDMFDIIDVKVEDESGNITSSPDKSSSARETSSKAFKSIKRRPFTSGYGSKAGRHKKALAGSKFGTKASEGKNKLSIFKKKSKIKSNKLREPVVPKKMKETKRKPKVLPSESAPIPPAVSSPIQDMCKSEKSNDDLDSSTVSLSFERQADFVAERPTECEAGGSTRDGKVATPSRTEKASNEVEAETASSRPHTPLSADHDHTDDPVPDPAALLNNPLIPRFPFPFGSGADSQNVASPAFPPAMFPSQKSPTHKDVESGDAQLTVQSSQRELERSPSVNSDASDGSRSFSPPAKRPPGNTGGLTPLERLEMADRAEKKKCKEHKKNKKDKKEKRKKDKKDREKRDKDERHEKKKKRLEKMGKEEDTVPKLTVRIGGYDSCAEMSPTETTVQSPPRLIIKPVRESSPQPNKKTKGFKKSDFLPEDDDVSIEDSESTSRREKEVKLNKSGKEKVIKQEKEKSGPGRKKKIVVAETRESSPESDVDGEPAAIITETVGSYIDSEGNKVWICPNCGRQDDGSPMIGCDRCDDWYHWVCVGIQVPPDQHEDWYCPRCAARLQDGTPKQRGRKRGRKKH